MAWYNAFDDVPTPKDLLNKLPDFEDVSFKPKLPDFEDVRLNPFKTEKGGK